MKESFRMPWKISWRIFLNFSPSICLRTTNGIVSKSNFLFLLFPKKCVHSIYHFDIPFFIQNLLDIELSLNTEN